MLKRTLGDSIEALLPVRASLAASSYAKAATLGPGGESASLGGEDDDDTAGTAAPERTGVLGEVLVVVDELVVAAAAASLGVSAEFSPALRRSDDLAVVDADDDDDDDDEAPVSAVLTTAADGIPVVEVERCSGDEFCTVLSSDELLLCDTRPRWRCSPRKPNRLRRAPPGDELTADEPPFLLEDELAAADDALDVSSAIVRPLGLGVCRWFECGLARARGRRSVMAEWWRGGDETTAHESSASREPPQR